MDKSTRVGHYFKSSVISGESYKSYNPVNLPFSPELDMSQLHSCLEKANIAIGRLDGISTVLPDPSLFIYMYVRKEAILSSQIEGTQSSLSDLLLFENNSSENAKFDDAKEVSCYVSALNYGLERLEELPLSLRLLKEIHAKLMNNTRGSDKSPGEFRVSQNWIGGSRPGNAKFVPPNPENMMKSLDNFEKFLHDDSSQLPILIKAAIAHVQFETIHPFLDGNGRLGRLLITLILCDKGILQKPLLYLSLYLKSNRQEYYDFLQSVRETGDWESWIKFFLDGVADTAVQATDTAQNIMSLFKEDLEKIESSGKQSVSILAINNYFQQNPISETNQIKKACKVSLPTVLRSLEILEKLNIIKEMTGNSRNKIFVYTKYLDILSLGTEPL